MAIAGTGKILTHVGLLDDNDVITTNGRKTFIDRVLLLLATGNVDGKSLPLTKVLPITMPQVPGPTVPAPRLLDPFKQEPLFWFEPEDPASILLSTPYLNDPESLWNKVFIDGLYAAMAKMLNLNGSYVPPLFDPTIYLPNESFDIPIDFPNLGIKIPQILLPDVLIKIAHDLGIPDIPIPEIPKLPPAFEIPTIPLPPIPPMINAQFAFPDFFIDFGLKIPGLIVPELPTDGLPELFLKFFNILLDIFLNLMIKFNLIIVSPKLLVATMLLMLHNAAVMIVCDILGLFIGAGGIVKGIAQLGGLTT